MSGIPIDPTGKLIHLTQKERDVIHNLWGLGLTVVARTIGSALFDLAMPPKGSSYQWHETPEKDGWKAVPFDRHPGVFAPWGTMGDIEYGDLYLLERPAAEVEAAHAASHAKARWNVDDWIRRQADAGFTGSVTMLGESESSRSAETVEIGAETPLSSKIPDDLVPHLAELLRERDRLVAASIKASIDTLKPPNMAELRASCLQLAIETIRKRYAEPEKATEASNGES
jgi:hypothetical protein